MPALPPFSPSLFPPDPPPSHPSKTERKEEEKAGGKRGPRSSFLLSGFTLEVSQEFREGGVELLELLVDQLELALRSVGPRALARGHLQLIHICFLVRK